jgi:hypothetical protein
MQSNRLDYEMGSHKPKNGDTIQWQIESKQTQTLMWRRLLNKKELEACKSPRCNPNGFQHGTRANGLTDGDTAPWQILDAHLCRWFPSNQKAFWGGTGAIGRSMKF